MAKRKSTKGRTRSTKHTYKTKDRVTRTPLRTGGELRCSGRVRSYCSTSGTRRVNLVTNPVISERGKDREVFTTSGTYPWSLSKNFISIRHGVSLSSRSQKERCGGKTRKNILIILFFLNASIKYKLELNNHKQAFLHSNI